MTLDLLDHTGAREILVDDVVAELEGLDLAAADVRRGVGQIPQVMLNEPQHRVGDHVVETVIGVGVRRDQADLIFVAVGGLHGARATVVRV